MRFSLTRDEVAAIEQTVQRYLTSDEHDRHAIRNVSALRAIGVDVPQRLDTRKRPPRSPEFRQRAAEVMRRLWQDPEFRAARAATVRATRARNKGSGK